MRRRRWSQTSIPTSSMKTAGPNAQLVEKAFYGGQGAESVESEQGADTQVADQAQAAGMDIQQLMKILSNPEMVNMLKMLSKTMG